MGTTAIYKYDCILNKRGNVDRKATLDREFSYGGTNVLKSAMAGGNHYAVLKWMRNGVVQHMLSVTKCATDRDSFYFKEMSDSMGPTFYDCPKAILDLADELCPCDDEYDHSGYAKAWRDKCRANIAKRNAPTAYAKLKPYDQVLWHIPEDSYLMCGGKSIAGRTVKLTKEPRRRQWQCYELGARVATKFVDPLDCELITDDGPMTFDEPEWRVLTNIRDWYIHEFPTDPLGSDLDGDVTFKHLYDRIAEGCDVYEVIGVGDSLVRERLFEHLALMRGVSYDTIYNLWLGKAA